MMEGEEKFEERDEVEVWMSTLYLMYIRKSSTLTNGYLSVRSLPCWLDVLNGPNCFISCRNTLGPSFP